MPRLLSSRARCTALALAALGVAGGLAAEVVDRIAAIVGTEAITASQIDSEMRLAAMLNRAEVEASPDAAAATLRRLVDRRLILGDRSAEPFLVVEPEDAELELGSFRAARYIGGRNFEAALEYYDLTAADFRAFVQESIAFEHYVSFRFKTGLDADSASVEAYYHDVYVQSRVQRGEPVEPLEAVAATIAAILLEQRANELLAERLNELRVLIRVEILARPPEGAER